MRGKVVKVDRHQIALGITPAHAGKSIYQRRNEEFTRDHPRMCGEKPRKSCFCRHSPGSPPHVRGKERDPAFNTAQQRITPAYAGKSHFVTSFHLSKRDHPRMCGEKRHGGPLARPVLGSPPHVRGKVTLGPCAGRVAGITPACAGKRLKRSRSTVPHAAIVPLFPSVCNKPAGSDGSPAGHDAPPFLPIENAAPASPAYNLRSL